MLISKPYMERRSYAASCRLWPEAGRGIEYPKLGFAIEQDVPNEVHDACERLVRAGFDSRLADLCNRLGSGEGQ